MYNMRNVNRARVALLFFELAFMSISCQRGIRVSTSPEPVIPMVLDSLTYEKDKVQIKKCYEANMEYQWQNRSKTGMSAWASDTLSFEYIDSRVLGIFYSPDLLRSVIFYSKTYKCISNDLRDCLDHEIRFDIRVFIGIRSKIEDGFTVYPNTYAVQLQRDEQLGFKRIKLYWYHLLHEHKDLNLGGKDFWEKSPLFNKVKLTDTGEEVYLFQTYEVPSLGAEAYFDNHFLHNVLDCSGEIDLIKNNGSQGVDMEFVTERRERKDR